MLWTFRRVESYGWKVSLRREEEVGRPAIAGIVLASGMSRRFGDANKLLVKIEGVPLVVRAVLPYLSAGLDPVIVVAGHEDDLIAAALGDLGVTIARNPDFVAGQSRALVRGIRSLPPRARAAVIGVADQPWLTGGIIRLLVETYVATGAPVVAPRYAGQRGNPALFDAALFAELLNVTGDQGGRQVIMRHQIEVAWCDVADRQPGLDVDSPEDLDPAG